AFVLAELLIEGAAQPLHDTADQLALDQHWVDGAPDIVSDEIALDRHRAGVAIDPQDGNLNAVGIGHVRRAKPAFRIEPGVAIAEGRRVGGQLPRNLAEGDRGAAGPIAMPHYSVPVVELVGRGLQQLVWHLARL